MPLAAQFVFKFHAFYLRHVLNSLVGENDVGDGEEEHEQPDHQRDEFAVVHRLDEGRGKGLHNLEIPVKADEPEEHDAHIHVHIEEHRGDPAHEHRQLPGPQTRVGKDLEGESQTHQKVGHDDVLEIDDETLGAGHVEEHPCGHAVEEDPRHEDQAVQHRDDVLGDEGVLGADFCWRLCGG